MAKKTYTVVTTVNHDNQDYQVGETIDLEDKHADPLLAVKAIEGPVEVAADPKAKK